MLWSTFLDAPWTVSENVKVGEKDVLGVYREGHTTSEETPLGARVAQRAVEWVKQGNDTDIKTQLERACAVLTKMADCVTMLTTERRPTQALADFAEEAFPSLTGIIFSYLLVEGPQTFFDGHTRLCSYTYIREELRAVAKRARKLEPVAWSECLGYTCNCDRETAKASDSESTRTSAMLEGVETNVWDDKSSSMVWSKWVTCGVKIVTLLDPDAGHATMISSLQGVRRCARSGLGQVDGMETLSQGERRRRWAVFDLYMRALCGLSGIVTSRHALHRANFVTSQVAVLQYILKSRREDEGRDCRDDLTLSFSVVDDSCMFISMMGQAAFESQESDTHNVTCLTLCAFLSHTITTLLPHVIRHIHQHTNTNTHTNTSTHSKKEAEKDEENTRDLTSSTYEALYLLMKLTPEPCSFRWGDTLSTATPLVTGAGDLDITPLLHARTVLTLYLAPSLTPAKSSASPAPPTSAMSPSSPMSPECPSRQEYILPYCAATGFMVKMRVLLKVAYISLQNVVAAVKDPALELPDTLLQEGLISSEAALEYTRYVDKEFFETAHALALDLPGTVVTVVGGLALSAKRGGNREKSHLSVTALMPQFLSRFPARSRDAMMRKMLELSLKELPADLQDAAIAFLLNAYRTCCLQGCVNAQALSQSCQMLVAFGTHLLDEVLKDDPLLVPWLMTLQELVLSIEALTTRRCRHDMQTCTINMQTPTLEIGVTETRDTETGKTNRGRSALSEAQMKSARKLVENLVSRLGTERRVNSDDQTSLDLVLYNCEECLSHL